MRQLPLCLLLLASSARASDPVGVYALVDQVTFEPDAPTATRARIQGWFAIATGKPGDGDVYLPPAHGYLYYQCPQGMEATCRMEWTDIAKSACSGGCVGFGSRYLYAANGSVRPLADAPTNPDAYPIQMGVTTMGLSQATQCAALAAAANGQPSACSGAVDMAVSPPADMATSAPVDMASKPPVNANGCSLGRAAPSGVLALLVLAAALLLRRRALLALVLLAPAAARASDPYGVYALVDKVVTEPNANDFASATRIQIWGWFAIADSGFGMGGSYAAPAQGYLYYQCPQGMEATCRMEWMDIAKTAATGDCAAWGSRGLWPKPGNGTVRPAAQKPALPDDYPIQMGVLVGQFGQCPALKLAAGGPPPDMAMAGKPDLAVEPQDMAQPQPADMAQPKPSPDLSTGMVPNPKPPASSCALGRGAPTGMGALAALLLLAGLLRYRRRG